mgnify:CR=1 FL=1
MIVKEIIQRVQSLYSKGVQSDDSRLSSRHIYSVILSIRDTLLVQKANKRQPISQWNFQTLNCVELIKAQPYECPCLPSVGCDILRTKGKLPKPLTGLIDGHMIQSVTSLEGSIIYSPTTWKDKKYKKGSKYTSNKPDYYIRDNYLYVTTKKGPKVISITGLFEDPLEAEMYPNLCGGSDCTESSKDNICPDCISPLDKDLPLDRDTVKPLIEMAAQELLSMFSQGREDISNNTRDSLKEDSK